MVIEVLCCQMKIIYGICSWGLGHATRSLPVIRKLIAENHQVTVISYGRALDVLKKELKDQASFIDIEDYPMLLSDNSRQFLAKSMIYWPVFIQKIEAGLQSLQRILQKDNYDMIISDGRYDMYNKKIPSFFMSHQMRIMNPLRLRMFESGSELFNLFFFKRFTGVIVPDYRTDDLSGDLSHNLKRIDEDDIHYIGVLSDFQKKSLKKDIDYLISISGPEPQRSRLQEKMLEQVSDLQGKVVMTLGKAEQQSEQHLNDITTYSFVPKEKREELLNRAKLVVSRSGYSTILDLAVIGTKALMIPTPGQIEQVYLGQYHNTKKTFFSVSQQDVQLAHDVKIAEKTSGVSRTCDVAGSVNAFMDVLFS